MTRLTVHEYAGALRPCYRAAKKGVKRAGLKGASLMVINRTTCLPQIGTD